MFGLIFYFATITSVRSSTFMRKWKDPSGSVLVTNGSGCGSWRHKTHGSYGSGSKTLLTWELKVIKGKIVVQDIKVLLFSQSTYGAH
jgi:hypothetical protein